MLEKNNKNQNLGKKPFEKTTKQPGQQFSQPMKGGQQQKGGYKQPLNERSSSKNIHEKRDMNDKSSW